jgi:hypothetical protein
MIILLLALPVALLASGSRYCGAFAVVFPRAVVLAPRAWRSTMAGHTKLDDESPVELPTKISAGEEGGDAASKAKGAEHGVTVKDGKSGIAGAVFNLANAVSVLFWLQFSIIHT